MRTLSPDELRREIDETLAELERLEEDVLELFDELLGPGVVQQIAAYKEAQKQQPRVEPLMRAASREPSTMPPATR